MIAVDRLAVSAGAFRLRDVSFSIPRGAHAMLTGPNGTGKTTTLEAICGLRPVDSGTILLGGCDVTGLPPRDRGIGFVPQEGALFPHLTVRGNVAFGLEARRWAKPAVATRVAELLALGDLLDRGTSGLSGGERQRVALGRALAAKPKVLLLDEPFSAVDAAHRENLRALLQTVRQTTDVTILHVTHHAGDAGALATMEIRFPQFPAG